MKAPRPLSTKQQRFAELYKGNATEAARLAGYKGSDATLAQVGHELLRKPEIAQAIAGRQSKELEQPILDRQQLQQFWTQLVLDAATPLGERLRASELLGKSQAVFTKVVSLTGKVTMAQLVAESYKPKPPEAPAPAGEAP